jgi:ABC-type multidrug transport system fused ATPase/permease subunit
MQEKISETISRMSEVFRYIKIVKVFTREDVEKERLYKLVDELKNLGLKLSSMVFMQKPLAELIVSFVLVIIVWYSSFLVINDVLKPSDVLAYFGYLAICISPISSLSASIFNTKVVFGYVKKFMDTIENLNEDEFDRKKYIYNDFIKLRGEIVFENVVFGYNNNIVLNGINFKINSGEKVAIIGKSGIGKSTLVSLLLKFYNPLSGNIYVDNINLKDINPKVIRNNISLLTQEIYLFNDTILENVRYSDSGKSLEDVMKVCKISGIHEQIISKSEGYNLLIGEDGKGLSGGQRQRISLARILLRDVPIIILDEPTSSLDPNTSNEILDSIFNNFKDKTIIVISHNEDVFKWVDRIFAIQDGKLIEYNKYDYLFPR